MKTLTLAYDYQVVANNIITAMEFLFPNVLNKKAAGNNAAHFGLWKGFAAVSQSIISNKGFNTSSVQEIYAQFENLYKVEGQGGKVIAVDSYSSVAELESHCVKNGLVILTANDFFYPNSGKMKSVNGNKISGQVFLLKA